MTPPVFTAPKPRNSARQYGCGRMTIMRAVRSLTPGGECIVRGVTLGNVQQNCNLLNAWDDSLNLYFRDHDDGVLIGRRAAETPPVDRSIDERIALAGGACIVVVLMVIMAIAAFGGAS